MLTFLGGGVLVLAVAGGAWALFGRDSGDSTSASSPATTTSSPARPAGPVVPGTTPKTTTAPTHRTTPTAGPAAATATQPAATTSPTSAPSPSKSSAPVASPSASPAARPPSSTPPVTGPQRGGTVTKKAFTFHVARGDTLWALTKQALRSTGRSTSNANVASYVAKLYQANKASIGSDPNLILVGSTISWPASL